MMFEARGTDGKNYQIEAPSMDDAAKILQQHVSGGAAPDIASNLSGGFDATDIGKSAVSGLAQGIVRLPGLPADVADLATGAYDWATNSNSNASVADFAKNYGGHAMQKRVEGYTGDFYKPKTRLGAGASTIASIAPAMIGGPGGLITRAATRAIAPGAVSEGLGQLAEGTQLETPLRIGGALVGGALPLAASRLISPNVARGAGAAERNAAAAVLDAEGVTLTAGMRTQNKSLGYMESELGGAAYGDRLIKTQEEFTGAALRRVGVNEQRATPALINRVEDETGAMFNAVAARNSAIPVNIQATAADMATVRGHYRNILGAPFPQVEDGIQRFATVLANNNGTLPGTAYQALRSDLLAQSRSAGDYQLRRALSELTQALDANVSRALSTADRAVWDAARHRWSNLLVIRNAVNSSSEAAMSGLITPANLKAAADQQQKFAVVRGRGEFAELARAGNQLLKNLPQSGTAPRAAARAIPAIVGGAIGGGIGSIPGMMIGAAAPWLAGRAIMSRPGQAYLGNQLAAPLARLPFGRTMFGGGILAGQ